MDTAKIQCPSCRNEIFIADQVSSVQCKVCSDSFELAGHMCPDCFTFHEEDEIVCRSCGSALSRICRACRMVNWSGHEICLRCGQSLDLLSQFAAQSGRATSDRLQEHMEEVAHIKEAEEIASLDRMSELLAIEQQRQVELQKQDRRRRQEERRVIIIVGAAVVLFLIAVLIVAIIGGLS